MSSARGNPTRKRPQKHQNRTAFKNDLHDTSHKIKCINSLEITCVCKRCKDILEWKIKYKKYKPLTAPRKCVGCEQKSVKQAYHMFCSQCAKDKDVCPKCCKPAENVKITEDSQNNNHNTDADLKSILKSLPERKRRTILRHLNKENGQQEIKSQIEDILLKMDTINLDDNSFFDGEFSDVDTEEGHCTEN